MKKDAREFAHLLKAFKGGAEYMWCNFDQVHLIAIYAECSAIEEEIQKEINSSSNTLQKDNSANVQITKGGGFSFSKLEDVPCTEEDEERYRKMFAQRRMEYEKKRQKKLK